MNEVTVRRPSCSTSDRHSVVLPVPISPVSTMIPSPRPSASMSSWTTRSCDVLW